MFDQMEYATYSSAEVCEGFETPPAAASNSSSSISSMMMMRGNNIGSNKKKNSRNNNNNINTRRFSDEQIKSLESIFETESRLEPRKKLQLARELGLQPRQVAIWFQNKRARWKSKQLERDYNILRNNYNSLASRFESLKKEKQALLIQLQKLNDLIQKPSMEKKTQSCKEAKSMDSESENGDTTKSGEAEAKPISQSSMAARSSEHGALCGGGGGGGGGALSDDDTSIKVEYFGNMEDELVNFAHDHGDGGSLTSPEDWGNFDSDDLLGQSTSDYQWWDFWS